MASVRCSGSLSSRGDSRGYSNSNSRERNTDSLMWSPTEDDGTGSETDALLSPAPGDLDSPKPRPNYSAVNRPPSDSGSTDTNLSFGTRFWWWACGGPRVAGCRCRWYWRDRLPKGKASALVFFLNVVESFAFYGATSGALKLILQEKATTGLGFVLTIALEFCIGRLVYSIMGVIADAYVGRHRMIHISLWLFWVAYGLLAIALSLSNFYSPVIRYVLPITAFVLVSIGAAGFEVNIIPFGMDQLQGASSVEMSSYFYWYYFGRQLGILCGLILFFILFVPTYAPYGSAEEILDTHSFQAVQPVVVLVMLTVTLLTYYSLQGWLFKDRQRENPLKQVVNVLWYAATVRRQLPRYRRAFRYGEGHKPRIELAKINYDGIYSSEAVEDVKTFCRMNLMLLSLGGYFMSYSAGFVMLSYQVSSLFSNLSQENDHIQTYLYPNIHIVYNNLLIVIFVLLLNYLVIPYLPPSMNMKWRLGCGMLLNMAALFSAALLEGVTHHCTIEHRLLWLMVPATMIAFGEMVTFVTGLEFIYAQSPESMKGLSTGLFYCVFGLSSGAGTGIYYLFTQQHGSSDVFATIQDVKGIDFILCYYIIFTVIAFLWFIMYLVVACLYTNRYRPPPPPFDDDWDRSHVHRVFAVRSE